MIVNRRDHGCTMDSTKAVKLIVTLVLVSIVTACFESSVRWLEGATGASPVSCESGMLPFNPHVHKKKYHVAVHATRGIDAARLEYQKVFSEYLTMTAGRRFETPIEFEMIPLSYDEIFDGVSNDELDFFFASPGVYSCAGVEHGASALATITSRLSVRGHTFDLDVFGGVIATRHNNDEINSINDLKDKVIGAGSITMIEASQLQFYEMEKKDMSFVMDPKQVVFTNNQDDIVKGVANGDFDVGFLRTDTIERYKDENGVSIDPDLFKIIQPKIFVMEDSNLFPFLHSTDIYPEWPVAMLPHVPRDVAEEVQKALLALGKHADVGRRLQECIAEFENKTCNSMSFPKDFDSHARCDTTKVISELALQASKDGSFAGFRPAKSYFEARSMQQEAGFITQDKRKKWHCTRFSNLYEGVVCPIGYFKRTKEAFQNGCSALGLPCKEGYDCYCKPCIKAHDVDVYPLIGEEDPHFTPYFVGQVLDGCGKMSLCGSVEQTKEQKFRIYDNKRREGANVVVFAHAGKEVKEILITRMPNTSWAYEFSISESRAGVEMLEILVDGEQIPESPIRVEVVRRQCDSDYGEGSRRVAGEQGVCVCEQGTVEMLQKCISSIILIAVIGIALMMTTAEVGYLYLNYKKRQGDTMWLVNVDELHFNEPLDIVGQGAFGVVLLAEYRGTKVAVKRVLPPNLRSRSRSCSRDRGQSRDSKRDYSQDFQRNPADSQQATPPNSSKDLEAQPLKISPPGCEKSGRGRATAPKPSGTNSVETLSVNNQGTESSTTSLHDILGQISYSREANRSWATWFCPCLPQLDKHARFKNKILGENATGLATSRGLSLNCFNRCDEQSKLQAEFIEEMRLLSRLRHPCITTVMGAVISPIHEPMLIMEYMEYGSLHDLLHNETMYAGGEIILQILRDIAQGMRYLHASRPPILHGDLKTKNILVDSRFRAKVCDFGLSQKKKQGIQGTPLWLAPEYLLGKNDYNAACDIYSLGIIFYEIYARHDPYEGEDLKNVLRRVCDPRVNKRPQIPESCPLKVVDVMKKCWSPDPFFRPTSKDLDLIFVDMTAQEVDPLNSLRKGKVERTTVDMLYEIFPRHIADALKAGEKVEPETHDNVTVFFSDIVGFTEISGTFLPIKVSDLLDRLYSVFDCIARKHHVFKVETIGDAYMGVTNLEGNQEDDHVMRIAEFAMDLVYAASQILIDKDNPDAGCVQIRAGFHSGAVVSNVVGSLNPRYGLFGDTVNTASRMESNSSKGRILCSERSALLLKQQSPSIPLLKRGKTSVKGKGSMTTYWVGGNNYLADEAKLVEFMEKTE